MKKVLMDKIIGDNKNTNILFCYESPLYYSQQIFNCTVKFGDIANIVLEKNEYSYIVDIIFKFVAYNLSPYFDKEAYIHFYSSVEWVDKSEVKTLSFTISFGNNLDLAFDDFSIVIKDINDIDFENEEDIINKLSLLMFKNYIGLYEDIKSYFSLNKLIETTISIFNLPKDEFKFIRLGVINYNSSLTSSNIYKYINFDKKNGIFAIHGLNFNHKFEIIFYPDNNIAEIYFITSQNRFVYILSLENYRSIEDIKVDMFEELHLEQSGYTSLDDFLDLLKIKKIIAY